MSMRLRGLHLPSFPSSFGCPSFAYVSCCLWPEYDLGCVSLALIQKITFWTPHEPTRPKDWKSCEPAACGRLDQIIARRRRWWVKRLAGMTTLVVSTFHIRFHITTVIIRMMMPGFGPDWKASGMRSPEILIPMHLLTGVL